MLNPPLLFKNMAIAPARIEISLPYSPAAICEECHTIQFLLFPMPMMVEAWTSLAIHNAGRRGLHHIRFVCNLQGSELRSSYDQGTMSHSFRLCSTAVGSCCSSSFLTDMLDNGVVEPASFRLRMYELLAAKTQPGMVLEALTVLLIIVNVLCFLLSTEKALEDNADAWFIFDVVELCTVWMHSSY